MLRGASTLAALLTLVVVVAAGTGWVYLLRELHVLSSGPRLQGALPLEQLAGASAQPFVRMLAAWLPGGRGRASGPLEESSGTDGAMRPSCFRAG